MAVSRIYCPKCKRVLGDTDKSLDCIINCPRCKAQHIKIKIVSYKDYLLTSKGGNYGG